MQPFVLADGKDLDRVEKTRQEMYNRLLINKNEGKLLIGKADYTDKELSNALDKMIVEQLEVPTYLNDKYQVMVKEINFNDSWPEMVHLSIRRLDREVIRDWRELQEIKNMLVGEENTGFEVFPAESMLVDSANQYHLWVFKNPEIKLPFGFSQRYVCDDALSTTKQRKL